MLLFTEEMTIPSEAIQGESEMFLTNEAQPDEISADETSIAQFCEFVDYYTRHSNDPLSTAAVCEQQAETLQITEYDVTPETIHLLIDTLLDAIEHLEKKWLDEQIQREDVEQTHHRQLVQPQTNVLARNQKKTWARHFCRTGTRWIWQRLVRSKPVPTRTLCPGER